MLLAFRMILRITLGGRLMHDIVLGERLKADTLPVTELPLCRVLLMNDARFPWAVLVPTHRRQRGI